MLYEINNNNFVFIIISSFNLLQIEKLKGHFKDDFPKNMQYLEKFLSENAGGDSYFAGNSVSIGLFCSIFQLC